MYFVDSQGLYGLDMEQDENIIQSLMMSICDVLLLNVDKNLTTNEIQDLKVSLEFILFNKISFFCLIKS